MKLSSFTTRLVSVPREAGLGGSQESVFVALNLWTGDGLEGIGYLGFVSPTMARAAKAALDALAEVALGDDPIRTEAIQARLLALGGGGAPAGLVTHAVAAIDVALWDIRGKAAGQPLYKLLGGYRDRVPAYASGALWRTYDLAALAETGRKLVAQGFRAMKFRLGAEDSPAKEIARMRALRDAVGQGIDLMVDINQGWSVNQAIAIGRDLEKLGLYWLEDPVHHQDYHGLARIAAALDVPVCAGEYQYGVMPFRELLQHGSIDIAMIDLMRAGGITGWMKIAHLAEAHNMPVVSHLAPEVLVHCVAAIPNGLTVEYMPWSLPLFKEPPRLEEGHLVLSDRPGLGLEFDETALERFSRE